MHDKDLVMEVLRQIEQAAAKIAIRFQDIRQVSDFTDSPTGLFFPCVHFIPDKINLPV